MATRHTYLWIWVLLLSGAVACKEDVQVTVSPSDGKSKVPVNVVLHVRFVGDQWVHNNELKKKDKFQLTECEAKPEPKPSPQAGAGKSSASAESDEDATAAPQGKAIKFQLESRKRYGQEEETGPTRKVTDVYAIPYSQSWEELPLQPNTRYCFSVADIFMEGQERKIAFGKTVSFITEERPIFQYSESTVARSPINAGGVIPELSPNEIVLMEFEEPVNPVELMKGTRLCKTGEAATAFAGPNGRSADNECGSSGDVELRTVYLVEDLEKEPESGYITASFDLYAVRGRPFESNKSYNLLPNLQDGTSEEDDLRIRTEPPIRFITRDKDAKSPADWLKASAKKRITEALFLKIKL